MKKYINYIKSLKTPQLIIHFGLLGIFTFLIIKWFMWTSIITALVTIGFTFICFIQNKQYQKWAVGNGIIAGGRGKGKGLLLNKRINTDPNKKHFTNVPYNAYSMELNIKEYIDSILPNTIKDFIEDTVKVIPKKEKFEKVNIYWDDTGVYAPNHMDNELKRLYPSLSALLPINRHAYDAYMIITVQDFERPYKLLRELQTDFSIKAIGSLGWGYIWHAIPFLSLFSTTKYIYYENTKSAVAGLLPFNAKALVNETLKHGYLTAGQATKETYEAQNGKIAYGRIWQRKNMINYDTRWFHRVLFGKKAPTN